MMVVVDAEPDRAWLESHRSVEVEPVSGPVLGVTDHDDPPSAFTLVTTVLSVNFFETPFRT